VSPQLSPSARKRLLEVARRALDAAVNGRSFVPEDVDPELRRPCGAFVTVRRREDRELRACLGKSESALSLAETVALVAAATAAADRRFEPLTAEELPRLHLEISALGPLVAVQPEQVEVGVHGIVVARGDRSGLLLPQVAVEHGFSRETFLEQGCRKAGLPPDAWRHADCDIRVFTATLISEEE
jgi:AmmeMemoRadiSam system protein A